MVMSIAAGVVWIGAVVGSGYWGFSYRLTRCIPAYEGLAQQALAAPGVRILAGPVRFPCIPAVSAVAKTTRQGSIVSVHLDISVRVWLTLIEGEPSVRKVIGPHCYTHLKDGWYSGTWCGGD